MTGLCNSEVLTEAWGFLMSKTFLLLEKLNENLILSPESALLVMKISTGVCSAMRFPPLEKWGCDHDKIIMDYTTSLRAENDYFYFDWNRQIERITEMKLHNNKSIVKQSQLNPHSNDLTIKFIGVWFMPRLLGWFALNNNTKGDELCWRAAHWQYKQASNQTNRLNIRISGSNTIKH